MKVSRFFTGVLIVLLGIALFLSNFNVLHFDWHFIFRLWPILLVLAGISVLVSNAKWRAALYAVTLVLVVAWVISAASVGWGRMSDIFRGGGKDVHTQEFAQEMSRDVRRASLTLKAGAGSFTLGDTTSDLFRATAESNIGRYTFDSDKEGSFQSLNLKFRGKEKNWNFGKSTNTLDLQLNTKPSWDLDIDLGASSANFNLVPYKVHRADIHAGASSITVRVGDRADTTNLSLQTGVATLVVYVPSGSGCRIKDKLALSSKSFPGFVKDASGYYKSPNYGSAKKLVFIEADAGVSTVKIERY